MIRRDLPEVLEIEDGSFPDPWSEEEFVRVLRHRNVIGMLAECGDAVVGFMLYELNKTYLEIFNLAIHPEWRRRGVGSTMIEKLQGKLSPRRRTSLRVHVRESNLVGQLFYQHHGFKAVSIDEGVYGEHSDEQAIRMIYRLPVEPAVFMLPREQRINWRWVDRPRRRNRKDV